MNKNSTINYHKSRFLVTGGAGFVGSHICDSLVKKNAREVVIIDNFSRGCKENLSYALKNGSINIFKGDIKNKRQVKKVMKGIDFVFHQAAIRITQCARDPRECFNSMLLGTFNILETAVEEKIKKIIFASSASVYGEHSYLPMDESHPFNNETLYGAAKIANEQMLRSFFKMYNLNYITLRYFNIYGPRMDIYGVYTEVLIRWFHAINRGEPPVIFGDGNQSMDFIFVTDVARANLLALESNINHGEFNIGSGKETTLNELVKLLLKLKKSHLQPVYKPERIVNPVRRREADISKARKELRFKPTVNLNKGLQLLIDWVDKLQK